MAIEEISIGHVTINNEVELEDQHYKIGYWIYDDYFELSIPRALVKREFHARGKARGVVSYYHGDDEKEHELTFEEWDQDNQYRDEFDAFIQELAVEQLHIQELKTLQERDDYFVDELADVRTQLTLAEISIKQKEAQISELRKQLYQALNPQVKKAS